MKRSCLIASTGLILALLMGLYGSLSPATAQSKAISTSPSPSPSPEPVPVPPTPTQSAIDGYLDAIVATGEINFGDTPTFYPANVSNAEPLPLADSTIYPILESVYQHRLTGPDDTIEGLIAADPEVAQAYQTLRSTGQLTTSADTDTAAVLHHLSLLRNGGTTGGFMVVGRSVSSTGLSWAAVYTCYVNLGGLINWAYGRVPDSCNPLKSEEAFVSLRVRKPNGELYRALTISNLCGSRSSFGFRRVPNGSAEATAFPYKRCCQSGRTAFQITCPPGPYSLLACIPAQSNQVVNIDMGPWSPPRFYGQVTGPGAAGATVWIGLYRDACYQYGRTSADSSGGFVVRGCLPTTEDLYLYAQGGNGYIGRTNVSDILGCGAEQGPISIGLLPPPTVSGSILDWRPEYVGKTGAIARGCFTPSCSFFQPLTITAPADSAGRYQLTLKPGYWELTSYRDFGYCTNSQGKTVRWICERAGTTVTLNPGDQRVINLQPVVSTCTCPQ